MQVGWYLSGAAHLALILMLLLGGLFSRDRFPEVTVSDVSVISEAEFAALSAPAAAPDIATDAPTPAAPSQDNAPDAPDQSEAAPEAPTPDAPEVPVEPETTADVTVPDPIPDALVDDAAPVIETPPTDIDGTSALSDVAPQPAPRVAPTPSIAPPPDAEIAPDVTEDTAPDPDADKVAEPETPAAPEEASDRIVTEAEEKPETAPATSMRPRTRPARPVQAVATPVDTPENDPIADAVAAAVAQANTPAPANDAPVGPPLTGGEKDALRVSVQQCWNVGSLSTEALGTTVTVAVSLSQDGKPDTGSVRMISSNGGSDTAARQAFEAARRAIIRCGSRGFPLPVEKYAQWRDIEMTFNPEGMQFR